LDAGVIELLAQNLSRLDQENDADRAGVYYVLSASFPWAYIVPPLTLSITDVLENLASQISTAERIGHDHNVMSWLLSRIQQKETPVSQNKQYAAEILAILLQSSAKNRVKFAQSDGVDVLLQLLSVYRKRDPEKASDEEEYVENLFDCLTCVVDENEGKDKFVESEGVELAQIMLREGKLSRQRALRVLDHVFSRQGGRSACERLVEVAGLKTIFGMFMKKV
jgi:beta-catenin-like protein 1